MVLTNWKPLHTSNSVRRSAEFILRGLLSASKTLSLENASLNWYLRQLYVCISNSHTLSLGPLMAPNPSEKAARVCLQEVNKLCHSIELTLNNGDPFAKRATDTLELHKVELLSSRLSLEEVKKKL